MKNLIPEAALGQHIAILGKTGSGKTFAAKAAIVEPVLAAGRRVGIVDPTDAWWGLRSSRDGKGAGFPVLVLGGDHGDLPLPANGGAAVARLLVEQGVNLVASTKHLTVGERTRWFIDFAGTVSRLNRGPLHLVLDEAHNFAPQGKVPDPDTGRMLHAANSLASGGRSIGVRLLMITQRPQKLHKDTLTSADTLIALRVLAPHDRQAVEDWIKGCGDMAAGKEVLNSLAGLKRGEGWVWYPEGAHLQRVRFPEIRTFDSSATPTDGHAIKAPKAAAEVDLAEVRAALAEAVKEAEANDPKLLRAEIARLKAGMAKRPTEKVLAIDHDAARAAYGSGWEAGRLEASKALKAAADGIGSINAELSKAFSAGTTKLASVQLRLYGAADEAAAPRAARAAAAPAPVQRRSTAPAAPTAAGDPSIGKSGLRRMLIALAQRPHGLSRRQLGVRAGMSSRSGTFDTYLSRARSSGWVNGQGDLQITEDGLKALGSYEPLPEGPELLRYWLNELGSSGAARILTALSNAYPRALTRAELGVAASMSDRSGTFDTYLSRLRSLELISGRGELKASEELFQ